MPKLVRYPRGFIRQIGNQAISNEADKVIDKSDGDMILQNLYQIYMGRSANPDSWEFQKRVIQRCSQLYGNFYHWLYLQVTANDCIYDTNLNFLLDTVNFIRTGKRLMSTHTWQDIILNLPEEQHGAASRARLDQFNLGDYKEFDNIIGQWCSHKDGFSDMLCTTYLLFGVSFVPTTSPV